MHEFLGHCEKEIIRKFMKHLIWSIKHGLIYPVRAVQTMVDCERVYFDISTIRPKCGEETIPSNIEFNGR